MSAPAPPSLEVLFTPADVASLATRDLTGVACVALDILRATSTIVAALDAGAAAVIPVPTIEDALAWRRLDPGILLGGERDGVRIGPELSGGVAFDLGNSPREHTSDRRRWRAPATPGDC